MILKDVAAAAHSTMACRRLSNGGVRFVRLRACAVHHIMCSVSTICRTVITAGRRCFLFIDRSIDRRRFATIPVLVKNKIVATCNNSTICELLRNMCNM